MGILHIIWTIIVVLFLFWLLGFILHIGGAFIHLLLIVAVILIIYNLITHNRSHRI